MAGLREKVSFFGIMLVLSLLVGVLLRIYQLDQQLVTGDEWHALHKVIATSYAGIASTFGDADHSIPVTLYFELLTNTIGLNNVGIYLPFLLCGLLAIVVIPIYSKPYTGTMPAAMLAAFLALSPFMIAYSRFARPYMPATLLAFLAVYNCFRWQSTGLKRHAVAFAISAVCGSYFLLAYLPFMFSPFLFFLPVDFRQRKIDFRKFLQLFLLGALSLCLLLLLIARPLINDHAAIGNKLNGASMGGQVVFAAVNILLGNAGTPVTLLLLLLALAGIFFAIKQHNRYLLCFGLCGLLQVASVYVLAPRGAENPIITARYILPALIPLVLLCFYGITGLLNQLKGQALAARTLFGAAVILLPVSTGALPHLYYAPDNAFVLNMFAWFLYGDRPQDQILLRTSEFYQQLAAEPPGSKLLVEVPFQYNLNHFFLYQKIHRQKSAAGFVNGLCGEPTVGAIPRHFPIRLSNFYYLDDLDHLRQSGVDFVVFHKLSWNEVYFPLASRQDINVDACIDQYRSWLGKPYFQDQDLVVFALASH